MLKKEPKRDFVDVVNDLIQIHAYTMMELVKDYGIDKEITIELLLYNTKVAIANSLAGIRIPNPILVMQKYKKKRRREN